MNHALRELGLGPDADERAVKRAYAARLKTTRPDTDPDGFQTLNAAYQAALAWVQSRSIAAATGAMASAAEADLDPPPEEEESPGAFTIILSEQSLFERLHSEPEPTGNAYAHRDAIDQRVRDSEASVETIRLNLDAFLADCVAQAARGGDGELLRWLNAQPVLWSLEHKAQIGHWLLQSLHERRPAIEAHGFDVLADFFGLLELNSGYDAHVIQRLRHRLHLAWEIQTEQLRSLAQRTGMDGGSTASNIRLTARILRQLRRPMNIVQALFAALAPMYPTAVRRFLHRLDFGDLDDLPPPVDPEQVAFWDAAGDRHRFSRPRWAVSAARLVAYPLAVTLAFVLLSQLRDPAIVGSGVLALAWPYVAAIAFATASVLWLGCLAHSAFNEWQALPESDTTRMPWL
jgi:hypothetical protein